MKLPGARKGATRVRSMARRARDVAYLNPSRDAELSLLLIPAMRERAGERRDGQIGRSVAVRDRLNNARRHEGQRSEISDMTLDLVLALRDLVEGLDPAFNEIAHPRARLCNRGQQHLDRLSIEIGHG